MNALMKALRRYLALLVIVALVHLFAGCSGGSSVLSANPGQCADDADEPGDVDENDDEEGDAGECEDDD